MTSMYPKKCVIPGCRNFLNKSVTLFRFPKDADLRKKWTDFVRSHVHVGEPRITTYSRLCSQHFTTDNFRNFHRKEMGFTVCPLLLVHGAEPTVALSSLLTPPAPPTSGSGASVCSTSPLTSTIPTPLKLECPCGRLQKVTREVGCQTDTVVEKRTVSTQLSEGTLTNNNDTELPHRLVIKEEEEEKFVADQQLCVQAWTSSLEQKDSKPLQIKEEPEEVSTSQEGEQLEVKQESDAFLLAPYEESDESEDQTLSPSTYRVVIGAEETPLSDISVMNSVKSESDTDHQLISPNLQEAESQDQEGGEHGESGSAISAEIFCNTRTYDRPFKCHICGEDFRFKSFWSRHQKVHADRDPCVCKICGRTLYDASALKRHIRIHTGEKPYSCEVCGRDFRHRGGLEVHMRIHRDEKPFPCETCGKSFRCLGVLNAHMKIHTGEKPYVCKTCDKGFCEMSALKRHMRSHTGEKPYDCKICGKDFRYRSGIQGHMKRVHPGEVEML